MKKIQFLCLLVLLAACNKKPAENDFNLLKEILLIENGFSERIFKDDLYQKVESTQIPEYVDDIYLLKQNGNRIYFNDRQSIFSYENGKFETAYSPNKGQGPNEIPQVFRFDIQDSLIAIAGYPDMRLLIHDLKNDSSLLINTEYRGHVLIDKAHDIMGENSSNKSSFMFAKFNSLGDSLASFGSFFNNQDKSLNMFDLYWDYNEKHDLIIIGFMYAGYYIVVDTNGNIKYVTESFHNGGNLPTLVNNGSMRYVDDEGNISLRGLSTFGDEVHIYTADAMENNEIYGVIIDVFDIQDGQYKFSYILEEKLHWPILLMDDYRMASVTEDYNLVIWSR